MPVDDAKLQTVVPPGRHDELFSICCLIRSGTLSGELLFFCRSQYKLCALAEDSYEQLRAGAAADNAPGHA